MPLTLVDHWVTLVPWSIWVYFSLWPYVLLLPAPYIDLRQLLWYLWGTLLMSGGALTVFFLWPSTVPPSRWGERSNHPGFSLLEGVDACGNACPSLHVAFTVFTAYGFQILLSDTGSPLAVRILNILWSAGICFSTLTTGQHVFLDLVGGTLLGTVTAALVLRSEKTSQSAGP
jgi:membrane-associated phospholipid phosphatase